MSNQLSFFAERLWRTGLRRQRRRLHVLAAAESKMVVSMAVRIHQAGGVPVFGAPAAVVLVRLQLEENKPAPLHLSGACPAAARELLGGEGQVHMLGSVAVEVIDAKRAHAGRERARGVGVRAAQRPAAGLAL